MRFRPLNIKLLAFLAISLSLVNMVRVIASIKYWQTLVQYDARSGPGYSLTTGLIGAVAFFILFLGIWNHKPWAWRWTFYSAFIYSSWYWLDRLLLQYPRPNWPFALIVNTIMILVTAVNLLSPRVRLYFSEEER